MSSGQQPIINASAAVLLCFLLYIMLL